MAFIYTLWRIIASVLLAIAACVILLVIAMVFMYPQVYPPNILPVILEDEVFVGREAEVEELTGFETLP